MRGGGGLGLAAHRRRPSRLPKPGRLRGADSEAPGQAEDDQRIGERGGQEVAAERCASAGGAGEDQARVRSTCAARTAAKPAAAASHSSGKGAPWKRAARGPEPFGGEERARARRGPSGRDEHHVGEEPEAERPPRAARWRAGGSPRRSRARRAGRAATSPPPGPSGISAAWTATRPRPSKSAGLDASGAGPRGCRGHCGRLRVAGAGCAASDRADQRRPAPSTVAAGPGADHADEVEPAVVGGEAHALAAVGADDHLADQDVRRIEAAVAGADHPVAGAAARRSGR